MTLTRRRRSSRSVRPCWSRTTSSDPTCWSTTSWKPRSCRCSSCTAGCTLPSASSARAGSLGRCGFVSLSCWARRACVFLRYVGKMLGKDADAAEAWVVDLIRTGTLRARISSQDKQVLVEPPQSRMCVCHSHAITLQLRRGLTPDMLPSTRLPAAIKLSPRRHAARCPAPHSCGTAWVSRQALAQPASSSSVCVVSVPCSLKMTAQTNRTTCCVDLRQEDHSAQHAGALRVSFPSEQTRLVTYLVVLQGQAGGRPVSGWRATIHPHNCAFRTFLKPMATAFSRKQRRHKLKWYLLMMARWLPQQRLQKRGTRGQRDFTASICGHGAQ